VLLEVDTCDLCVALRAVLTESVVDEVDVVIALSVLAQLERPDEIVVDRRCQPLDFLVGQVRRRLER
jgi:hypothetical protein